MIDIHSKLMVLKAAILRNRVKIFDVGMILSCLGAAAVAAFELDVFATEGVETAQQQKIELNEVLALTLLAMTGLLIYLFRRAVEHRRENALRIEAEQEALTLAFQDPLTGLPNRRRFDEALKGALQAMPTAPEAHALLLLDLNGFKTINDVYGHPTGDQALIRISARLRRAMRDGDLVARLGGDEFAVLAKNVAGSEGATTVALRIIGCFDDPVELGGQRHPLGAAVGVALTPLDGETGEELMRKADVALYRAKAEGGSTVRFFEAEMDTRLRDRSALERDLRAALLDDDFELSFRPRARIDDGELAGFEATCRWVHPHMGEIGQRRFAPIAQSAGLLGPLFERLLRRALAAASSWPPQFRLSFEAPGELVSSPGFGLRIAAALADTRFPPARLDLEIDEGALIRDPESAEALIKPLKTLGVSLVAANFGTGYADLKRLQGLKLDRVRIDRSFVAAMTDDAEAASMVKALIAFGRGLDLEVIAEGVTSEAQSAALMRHGCGEARGAFFGAPLSERDAFRLARPEALDASVQVG